ncbi:hypothetical protein BGZ61DRAFT_172716 [Ilyonectria robusta]|uniref:uncharacterized protein n=1 Tax=Ilyonectria robusta TaxID=1079257 RepID=UPI001E8D1F80|nr:uncharacterized protein BGZ61DRAFT_172716 [Ilyonectria robusta]KAH8659492.1 hypothetical protein BGZ61DRAFT_172716 [Ilyonectria robusta]
MISDSPSCPAPTPALSPPARTESSASRAPRTNPSCPAPTWTAPSLPRRPRRTTGCPSPTRPQTQTNLLPSRLLPPRQTRCIKHLRACCA